MPVYNFICSECGAHFEHWLSFQDANKTVMCPKGHPHTRRVLTIPTVVFKGSGFYVTDHRSKVESKS